MKSNKEGGLDLAFEAADESVGVGKASALEGAVKGRLGYTLTNQALKEDEAVMVFPLIALSSESIFEGLARYLAEQSLADTAAARVSSLAKKAEQTVLKTVSSFESL